MSRQQTLLAGIVLGAVAAVGLIIHLSRSDRPGTPGRGDVNAADNPTGSPEASGQAMILEVLTGHSYKTPDWEQKPVEVRMWAFRVTTGKTTRYFVRLPFHHMSISDEVFITAEDAAALMKFHPRAKGKKLESKQFTNGYVDFVCRTPQGDYFNLYRKVVVRYDLKEQKITRRAQRADGTWASVAEADEFFTKLEAVLKEVEASKGEKPTVEP